MVSQASIAHWHQALDHAANHRPNEALRSLPQALALSDEDGPTLALAARILVLAGDPLRADEVLQLVDHADSNVRLARAYVDGSLGRTDEALASLAELHGTDGRLDVLLNAVALATSCRARDVCVRLVEETLRHPELRPSERLFLGRCAHKVGAIEKTLDIAQHLIEQLSPDSDEHAACALLLIACGDFDTAADHLERRLSLNAADKVALRELGTLQLWKGNTASARKHAEQLLSLDSGSGAAQHLMVGAAVLEGRWVEGLTMIENAAITGGGGESFTPGGQRRYSDSADCQRSQQKKGRARNSRARPTRRAP